MIYENVLLFLSFDEEHLEALTAYTMIVWERRFLLHIDVLPA